MKTVLKVILLLFLFHGFNKALAQYPIVYSKDIISKAEIDPMSRVFLTPQRIVWRSSDSLVVQPGLLLEKGNGQAFFENRNICKIINKGNTPSGLILDFGKEIMGGIQITTSQSNRVTRKIRIRFGESVSETSSDVIGDGTTGKDGGATNHHSMRDFEITLPGYGTTEVGNSGFRFVRIDLVEPNVYLALKEIRGIALFRNIPYLGSFKCNDERLNKIWQTGAYTVHLNMQEYLTDGIKRDRMVWGGDMHPELMTISNVFGYNEVVPKSLDFLREHAPLPKFMNGISAYSMWWVIMQYDWYMYHGRLDYLRQQKSYLISLLDLFTKYVNEQGIQKLDSVGFAFLDWPNSPNKKGIHAGLQALLVMTFEKGAKLCHVLNEKSKAEAYTALARKMRKNIPDANHSKEAASLLSLAGLMDARKADNDIIAVGGPENFSAYFGYYMLLAQAKAGDYKGALDNIRQFWGAMLDLGATTFWEEFDLKEAENAAPIDNIVPSGKLDYHRNTGAYCYIGLRRSLCHGWSSGPTPWLTENVLGIKVLEPGCKKIKIEPHLADLEWVEGTFPTPMGILYVKHTKLPDGSIKSSIKAPKGVIIVK
jgi:alpha-L-rhamnosidase